MHQFIAVILLAGCALFGSDAGGLSIKGLPEPLEWENAPTSVNVSNGVLTIGAGPSTDWYISPLDGKRRTVRHSCCFIRLTISCSPRS